MQISAQIPDSLRLDVQDIHLRNYDPIPKMSDRVPITRILNDVDEQRNRHLTLRTLASLLHITAPMMRLHSDDKIIVVPLPRFPRAEGGGRRLPRP